MFENKGKLGLRMSSYLSPRKMGYPLHGLLAKERAKLFSCLSVCQRTSSQDSIILLSWFSTAQKEAMFNMITRLCEGKEKNLNNSVN